MSKTVLFVHGLESGPNGRKARALAAAGFTVVAEQMPCGRKLVARDPAVIAAATSAALVVAWSTMRRGLAGLAVSLGVVAAATPVARSLLVRRMLHRSIEVQKRALARHHIDVVVGSSFGGAVAIALIQAGIWTGPTVLLCPAHGLVAQRAALATPPSFASLSREVQSRIVVVHGRSDETVPVAHSSALIEGSGARLVLVEDDHRLSRTATPERLTEWIAMTAPR